MHHSVPAQPKHLFLPFINSSPLCLCLSLQNLHNSSMADDGLEAFHVPQQSRRDKLRFTLQNHPPQPPFSLPLISESRHYDGISFRAGELRSSVPLGPFTGYASILKRSRFLKPAQQLLEDFCGSVLADSDPPPPNCWSFRAKDHRVDVQIKNSRLTNMLEEVYYTPLINFNYTYCTFLYHQYFNLIKSKL